MKVNRDKISLLHMVDHAREAVAMLNNVHKDEFIKDRTAQLAVTRLVEVIGEAAYRISNKTQDSYPEIPWRQMIGMRNRLIHGYDVLDLNILWNTVKIEIPLLIEQIDKVLSRT